MCKTLLTCIAILLFSTSTHIECQNLSDTQAVANTTAVPPNNTDIANTSQTTTEEPISTTSSSVEPSEDEAFRHYIHYNEDYCVCDLRLDWCDINCCCDHDCSESEKSSFGECIETRKQLYDSRYCSHKNIVYVNNTQTKLETTSNGLFCIVWDNSGRRLVFDDPKPITDANRLLNITAQHNHKWSLTNIRREAIIELRQNLKMKSGKSVLISRESNETRVESHWELPFAGVTRLANCNTARKVQYLIDFQSSCYRFVRNVSQHCLKNEYLKVHYFKSFRFVSKFDNDINITSDKNLKTFYDYKNKICRNVVQSVHYTVWHNGSNGVLEAEVTFGTIDLQDNNKSFKQSFEVSFRWYNRSSGLELSGNPGYIVGKPILSAVYAKDTNLSRSANGYEMLSLSNGFCDNVIKKPIEFGFNWRSGCLLRFGDTNKDNLCDSVQRSIWKVLEPESNIDVFIGVFGNSSVDTPSDWTKLLVVDNTSIDTLNDDNCPILVTGVSLYLYYVTAGTAVQPQHKIVGAVKKFRTQSEVRVKCLTDSVECEDLFVELSTSVTFVDITRPARPDYAPPLAFKIQLPSDFFYPFMASNAYFIQANVITITMLMMTMMALREPH